MPKLFSGVPDRSTVVFHLWQSLPYPPRMALACGLVVCGCILQALSLNLFPGIILIAAGNALLLVKGYDNRIESFLLDLNAAWVQADEAKVLEILKLNGKMIQWDRSALDITNKLGFWVAMAVGGGCAGLLWYAAASGSTAAGILGFNGLVLLMPHWVTGVRKILTTPGVIVKILLFGQQLKALHDQLTNCTIDYFLLLGGDETRIPRDVKLRIRVKDQHPDFLGLYVQIATNTVNGTSYPYLYTVLVAQKEYGLKRVAANYRAPSNITSEYSIEGEVEVLVVRQTTTKTSGYHTSDWDAKRICGEGLTLAAGVANAPRTPTTAQKTNQE